MSSIKKRISPTVVSRCTQSLDVGSSKAETGKAAFSEIDLFVVAPILEHRSVELFQTHVLELSSHFSFASSCHQGLAGFDIRISTIHYHIKRVSLNAGSPSSRFRLFLMSVLYSLAEKHSPRTDAETVVLDELPVYQWKERGCVLKEDLCAMFPGISERSIRRYLKETMDEEACFVDDLFCEVVEDPLDLLLLKWMSLFHPVPGAIIHGFGAKVEIISESLAYRIVARIQDRQLRQTECRQLKIRELQ